MQISFRRRGEASQCGSVLPQAQNPQRRLLLQGLLATVVTGLCLPAARAAQRLVTVVEFGNDGQRLGVRQVQPVVRSEAEWRRQLSPLAYSVTRESGTERAFSGDYQKPDVPGIFRCICCGTALFDAATEFHSGTGWPSFWQPIARENVREQTDTSFGMRRTSVSCARCAAHLGHVFEDGPPPTGLRYCMNSVALRFAAASKPVS